MEKADYEKASSLRSEIHKLKEAQKAIDDAFDKRGVFGGTSRVEVPLLYKAGFKEPLRKLLDVAKEIYQADIDRLEKEFEEL